MKGGTLNWTPLAKRDDDDVEDDVEDDDEDDDDERGVPFKVLKCELRTLF